ncbi:MAG: ImmA/IrrE family metallo-endopeptidase [Lachnospiraceae bacterium]|nr:ImmA/IrrE family metallo-endopeptidase [Lachnospiraceae bacterium]
MDRKFLKNIRKKSKEIDDMPKRAQEVLDFFHVEYNTSAVPIIEILTKMGFKIFQSDLEPDDLSAYIAVDPKFKDTFGSNKITCVHVKDNPGHKTFALAHELAHYLFDFDESKSLYYYDTYFPKENEEKFVERRANKFAANLLMPKEIFLKEYEKCKNLQSKADIVNELGRRFRVSPTAVLIRFQELGITGFDNNGEI